MTTLTVYLPGLFGPDAFFPDDYIPQLPALELMLARAHRQPGDSGSFHQIIYQLMGAELRDQQDVPVAALCRLLDADEPPRGFWMRADPVHLSADRDGLVLMDSFALNITHHDALALAAEVKQVIDNYGWSIEVPTTDRWYISMEQRPGITTTDLSEAVGKDINYLLPKGPEAKKFHHIFNEIQMQLHSCDLNQLRVEQDELPVNSVWFWGGGQLPQVPEPRWSAIYGEDIFLKALAAMTHLPCSPVPDGPARLLGDVDHSDNVLLVLDHCQVPAQYQNLQLWYEALLLLEKTWFVPLLKLLRWRKIKQLRFVTDSDCFQLDWLTLNRIWRRTRSIGTYSTEGAVREPD